MPRIVAINQGQRFAVLDDDRIVPITNLFDAYGDETEDFDQACSFVAGADREWFSEPIADFMDAAIH